MAVAAYMLSLLARQRALLGDRFLERYPSNWLVWEPGVWRPARSASTSNTEQTQLPTAMPNTRPSGDDALCFELKRVASDLTVGRGTENAIVVNDLTVSRTHLHLEFAADKWTLKTTSQVTVDGKPIGLSGALLMNGAVIGIGDVRMTFYEPKGFNLRLQPQTPPPSVGVRPPGSTHR
jgi:pSer/pThr/pTyr-binding forkhead associated (FHA) protein